jgi:hypothetical protein
MSYFQPRHQYVDPTAVSTPAGELPSVLRIHADLIKCHLVNIIQRRMAESPLRTMFFNAQGENGFSNRDFFHTFHNACQVLALSSQVNQLAQVIANQTGINPSTPEALIEATCEFYISYRVAKQIENDPQLQNNLSRDLVSAAGAFLYAFKNEVGAAEQAVQQMQRGGGFGGNMNGGFNNNMGGNRFDNTPPATSASWATSPGIQAPQQNGYMLSSRAQVPERTNMQENRFGTARAFQHAPTQQQNHTSVFAEPVTQVVDVIAVRPEDGFIRSDSVPYDEAVNLMVYDKSYDVENGMTYPIIKRKAIVDRSKHLPKSVFAPSFLNENNTPTIGQIEKRLKNSADEVGNKEIVERILVDNWTKSPTLEEALIDAHHDFLSAEASTKIQLRVSRNIIIDSVVFNRITANAINDLLIITDCEKAASRLTKQIEAAGFDYEQALAWKKVDARLTERINRYITCESALEYGNIDSFSEDVAALPEFLKGHYSKTVYEFFLKKYEDLVGQALSHIPSVDEEQYEAFNKAFFSTTGLNPETKYPVHFKQDYVIGKIQMSSVELAFDLPNQSIAYGIQESSHALLHEVATKLVDSAEGEEARYLLITSDGVKFEIHHGAFNHDYLLISLYK